MNSFILLASAPEYDINNNPFMSIIESANIPNLILGYDKSSNKPLDIWLADYKGKIRGMLFFAFHLQNHINVIMIEGGPTCQLEASLIQDIVDNSILEYYNFFNTKKSANVVFMSQQDFIYTYLPVEPKPASFLSVMSR